MEPTKEHYERAAATRCAEIVQEVIDGMDEPDFEFNSDIYGPIQFAIRREFGLLTPESDSTDSTPHQNPKSDTLVECPTD